MYNKYGYNGDKISFLPHEKDKRLCFFHYIEENPEFEWEDVDDDIKVFLRGHSDALKKKEHAKVKLDTLRKKFKKLTQQKKKNSRGTKKKIIFKGRKNSRN